MLDVAMATMPLSQNEAFNSFSDPILIVVSDNNLRSLLHLQSEHRTTYDSACK